MIAKYIATLNYRVKKIQQTHQPTQKGAAQPSIHNKQNFLKVHVIISISVKNHSLGSDVKFLTFRSQKASTLELLKNFLTSIKMTRDDFQSVLNLRQICCASTINYNRTSECIEITHCNSIFDCHKNKNILQDLVRPLGKENTLITRK